MKLSRTIFAEDCMQLNVSDTVFQLTYKIKYIRSISKKPPLTKKEIKAIIWEKYCDNTSYIEYKGNSYPIPISLACSKTKFDGIRFYYICPKCTASVRKLYSPDFERNPFLCNDCYNIKYYSQHYGKSVKNRGLAKYRSARKKLNSLELSLNIKGRRNSPKRRTKLENLINITSSNQSLVINQFDKYIQNRSQQISKYDK